MYRYASDVSPTDSENESGESSDEEKSKKKKPQKEKKKVEEEKKKPREEKPKKEKVIVCRVKKKLRLFVGQDFFKRSRNSAT